MGFKQLFKKTIFKTMKQYRKEKGYSQKDIAYYSSITQAELSNFENGKTNIRLSTLEKIAKALDLRIIAIPKNKLSEIEHLLSEDMKEHSSTQSTYLLDKYGISDEE